MIFYQFDNKSKQDFTHLPSGTGFTLIEALIYFAVFSLILGAIIKIEIQTISTYNRNYYQEQVGQNILHLSNYLQNKLEGATNIVLSQGTDSGGSKYQLFSFTASDKLTNLGDPITNKDYTLKFDLDNNMVDICKGDSTTCDVDNATLWLPLLDSGVQVEPNNYKICFSGSDAGDACVSDSDCTGGACLAGFIEEDVIGPCLVECGTDDGDLDTEEECDDGNNNNGDGCSATCSLEQGVIEHNFDDSSDFTVSNSSLIIVDDGNNNLVKLVDLGGGTYSTEKPYVELASPIFLSNPLQLNNIVTTITVGTDDNIEYSIKINGTDKWWNGSNWVDNSGNTNTKMEMDANLSSLTVNHNDSVTLLAYLVSDGTEQVEVDNINLNYLRQSICGDKSCNANNASGENLNTCTTAIKEIKFHLKLSTSGVDTLWSYASPAEMNFTMPYNE
jgi:cysteine-rich repeat protein